MKRGKELKLEQIAPVKVQGWAIHGDRSHERASRVDHLHQGHHQAMGTLLNQVTEEIFEKGMYLCFI